MKVGLKAEKEKESRSLGNKGTRRHKAVGGRLCWEVMTRLSITSPPTPK